MQKNLKNTAGCFYCPRRLPFSLPLRRPLYWGRAFLYPIPDGDGRRVGRTAKLCAGLYCRQRLSPRAVVYGAVLRREYHHSECACLALALLLTRGLRGTNFFRGVFFMPNLIGGIVLGYIWNLLINGVLAWAGVDITYQPAYGFGGWWR